MARFLLTLALGAVAGYLIGASEGYGAGVQMAQVVASCPNYDSLAVSYNQWRPADQQTRPPRIVYPQPECRK